MISIQENQLKLGTVDTMPESDDINMSEVIFADSKEKDNETLIQNKIKCIRSNDHNVVDLDENDFYINITMRMILEIVQMNTMETQIPILADII